MRLCLLLLVAACDATLTPDPPAALPYVATAFSVANNHTLLVIEATPGDTVPNLAIAGTDVPRPVDKSGQPVQLSLPSLVDVAVGRRHACALSTTGSVHCWGDDTHGALGAHRTCTPPATAGGVPNCILDAQIMPTLPPVRALAAGDDVTCAITKDDRVVCWGVASRTGGSVLPALDPPTPVKLPDGSSLAAARVIIGHGAVCAIDRGAALWCWGDGFGALPTKQPQTGVVDLAIGTHHSCVIDARGLSCWGDDRNGQLGDVAFAKRCGDASCVIATPHHVELDGPVRVVVGERHTCALLRDGSVTCWGSNEVGQLGRTDAFLVGDLGFVLDGAEQLAAGYAHTCAMRHDRQVWCWGSTDARDPSEEQTP